MVTAERPRIVVVGLGPGGHEHVTVDTLDTIERATHRFLRTSIHPSSGLVPDATTFDHLYESADTFDDVYTDIADTLAVAASTHGEILYAVPGSPLVLERTVRHLLARDDIDCDIRPAMSFLDVAWARLGLDPVEARVRLVDGHDFATAAAGDTGPLLVAHTHANWVLSDIKLAVDEATGDEPVTLLHALGTPDERIVDTTWADVDRTIDADHLTSLWIPQLGAPVGSAYVRFHQLTRTLREQCPWDIEQTHDSLVPYLLEEAYEVVDAIHAINTAPNGDTGTNSGTNTNADTDTDNDADTDTDNDADTDADLVEELGDLLYQIEFHATIAEQEGRFTIADVANGIHDKLVRRHPHVFGDLASDDLDTTAVLSNWDDIKREEKGRTSVFDGIPRSMPALAYAAKVGKKASKVGFDWPDVNGAFPKIDEESAELRDALDDPDAADTATTDELGDLLFAVVNVARHLHIDPELALRAATDKFRARFEGVERLAAERSIDLRAADLVTLDALWDEIKAG